MNYIKFYSIYNTSLEMITPKLKKMYQMFWKCISDVRGVKQAAIRKIGKVLRSGRVLLISRRRYQRW